jgi:hypothetical protein
LEEGVQLPPPPPFFWNKPGFYPGFFILETLNEKLPNCAAPSNDLMTIIPEEEEGRKKRK